jgi:hypothetical protein
VGVVDVRGVTSGVGWIAAITALAGCYASHVVSGDGGPRDAGPRDAGPRDAAPRDAPVRDAPGGPLPPCDAPFDEWRPLEASYPGVWVAALRARAASSTSIVASSLPTQPLQLLRFDGAAPPALAETIVLETTEGVRPVAVATDGAQLATIGLVDADRTIVLVHGLSGALLSSGRFLHEPERAIDVAITGGLVAIAREESESAIAIEVRDVAGGPPLVGARLEGHVEPAIGLGRRFFQAVATLDDGTGRSALYGADSAGLVPGLTLDPGFRRPSWDGPVLVGNTAGEITVRHSGGRLDPRGAPFAVERRPSVADGPHGAVVVVADEGDIALSLEDDGSAWRTLASGTGASDALADTAPGRVGAFFLDRGTLRWSGLGCLR